MSTTARPGVEVLAIDTPALGDRQEWDASHISGAVHIPIHQLPSRLAEVPAGEVWVHCEAGYRACIAASFLDAAGRAVVAVDDEFRRAAPAGLPVEGEQAHVAAKS